LLNSQITSNNYDGIASLDNGEIHVAKQITLIKENKKHMVTLLTAMPIYYISTTS
jgi:hypothetical protein